MHCGGEPIDDLPETHKNVYHFLDLDMEHLFNLLITSDDSHWQQVLKLSFIEDVVG